MVEEPQILYPKDLSCAIAPGQDLFTVDNGRISQAKVIGYPYFKNWKNFKGGAWFLPVKKTFSDNGREYTTEISLSDSGILANSYNDHKTYNSYLVARLDAQRRGYPQYQPKDANDELFMLCVALITNPNL